ncbi:DUF6621 family protein [Bacteroides sp. 51]|uniref:DUF6621 family protein n=1 Tax=Bacteroides sp. 51 TaxID=2302938 RepID=UPI0013D77F0F|nr:DUF6621 family protein [Bacteroides sp. 51]NDV83863.1 hypothetical protein [Bacteroides sp. 51]
MKENQINFPETVILIDAVLLNAIVKDFKKNFEEMLQRPLQKMDVAQFVVNLALDANMPVGNKEIQVIFVYDELAPKLSDSMPSDLKKELNGVAFQDSLGEFVFASLSLEEMVSREDLYFDLLRIVGESVDVKRVIVVPFEQNNKETIHSALEEIKGKEVTLFGMNKPERVISYSWQLLAYPVMQALGIRGDEMP